MPIIFMSPHPYPQQARMFTVVVSAQNAWHGSSNDIRGIAANCQNYAIPEEFSRTANHFLMLVSFSEWVSYMSEPFYDVSHSSLPSDGALPF